MITKREEAENSLNSLRTERFLILVWNTSVDNLWVRSFFCFLSNSELTELKKVLEPLQEVSIENTITHQKCVN